MSKIVDTLKSSLIPLSSTGEAQLPTQGASPRPTLKLFASSDYDDAPSVTLANGTTLQLPTLGNDEKAKVEGLFGGLSDADRSKVSAATERLGKALFATLQQSATGGGDITADADTGSDGDSDDDASWTVTAPNADAKNLSVGGSATPVPELAAIPVSGSQLPPSSSSGTPALAALTGGGNSSIQLQAGAAGGIGQATTKTAAEASTKASTKAIVADGAATTAQTVAGGLQASVVTPAVTPALSAATSNAAATYNSVGQDTLVQGTQGYGGKYDKTVEAVTYMGVIGLQDQLGQFAQQVQGNLDTMKESRVQLADVRTAIANWPDGQATQEFQWTTFDDAGRPVQHDQQLTLDQANALEQTLSSQIDNMTDMNQMDQIKLQNMTQNYQQAINTLSNMLKFEHDTVKSIINNIHS